MVCLVVISVCVYYLLVRIFFGISCESVCPAYCSAHECARWHRRKKKTNELTMSLFIYFGRIKWKIKTARNEEKHKREKKCWQQLFNWFEAWTTTTTTVRLYTLKLIRSIEQFHYVFIVERSAFLCLSLARCWLISLSNGHLWWC